MKSETESRTPAWLDDLAIAAGDHVIAIVSEDRDVDLLTSYYSPALEAGDPCVAVASPETATEIAESLREAELVGKTDLLTVHNPGQLGTREDGNFDVEQFLARGGEDIGRLIENGATRIRHGGIMRWLDDVGVSDEDRIYLEARINQVIEGSCMSGFCVYDSRHIGGHLLVQLLRTHPKVLLDGRVIHNPFYTTPDKVIEELGR